MKKLYFLFFIFLMTAVSFGQVIVSDNFNYSDGSLVPNGGWVSHSGAAGDLLVSSGLAVVQHGTPSEDANLPFGAVSGNIYYAFDFSVDDLGAPYSNAGTDYEYFAHFKDAGFNFSARLDIVPPAGGGDFSIGIASDESTADAVWATDLTYGVTYRAVVRYDQDNNIAELWIDASASTDTSILGEDRADPGDSVEGFALRQSDSDENETIRVDNVVVGVTFGDVVNPVTSTTTTITINSPSDFAVLAVGTTSVDIIFTTANLSSGDQVDITVTKNGGTPNKTTDVSSPFTISGTADGDTFVVTAEIVNGATQIDFETIDFSIASITQVSSITELRAGTEGDYYELTSEGIITYSRTSRNQKYIEDAPAASRGTTSKTSSGSGILIDDSAGTITTTYNIGDGMTGLKGRLSSFSGVLQFVPLEDPGTASSTGNTVTPEVVTASELATNWENYESELVEIKAATFVGASGNFETSTNYTINDGTSDLTFRTNFSEADYIGMPIPTIAQNLVVLVAEFNGTPQVTARALTDITLRVERNAINGFSLYPNPVTDGILTINTFSNADKKIQIFDILGKQVLSTNLRGRELNVSKLNSGVYILKILEEGKSATRKLVIQ